MTEERRVVTVLFADVTGSTALGAALDPEDLRALLSRYYSTAKEVVAAHGGTVEKFIGDAVMAVFGLRQAHGDDAARALAAALELRDRVRADARLGERLPIRLGVNTGDVVASRDAGSDDFLVTGDAVNIAARLQQAATPWAILAGERTVRAAHGQFRFGSDQSLEAKGKAWGVVGSEVLGRARVPAARMPIFGRAADIAQLDLVARRAFGEQRPYMVSVIAPPGTGKSRLLEEFLDHLPEIEPTATVAVAQCLPYGQRLTYWPLRAVLFRIAGLSEDAQPDEIREAVAAWLRERDVNEADEVGALLSSTVGAGEAESVDRSALFTAWRTFVEVAARHTPLVVAVEDLHWSSDTLLDLLEFVLQPRGDTRALMIALARPELLDRRPGWGGGRRNHVSIALEPLDDDSIGALVSHLAEGAPAGFIDAVVERAEGNPFFAGEIVNALLEGVISFDDPAEVGRAMGRLPDTVQATVLARLDLLPDEEREQIRVAAVFGRQFRAAGIATLLERGDLAQVEETCERLVDRDLIRPVGSDSYVFRHILIREVAYSTLPRAARVRLHGAAGRWLAERAAGSEEAYAELVAFHFREAASLARALDQDDDELRDLARTWLVRAANVAQAAAASLESRQHVREAITFARDEDLVALYELLGDVEIGGTTILDAYRRALALARDAGRGPDDELRLLSKILTIETRSQGSVANRASLEEFNKLRIEARGLVGRVADRATLARYYVAEAFVPFWLRMEGETATEEMLRAAEANAIRGYELAVETDNLNMQSAALDGRGSIALDRAQWNVAMDLGRQRIAMGTRLVLFEQLDAHSVTTWSAVVSGKLKDADEVSAHGLALLQPGQALDWALHLLAWRALTLVLVGKWDEAEIVADRMHSMWLESGQPAAGYSLRGFAAALIVARARGDDARVGRWSDVIETIGSQFPLRREQYLAAAAWDIPRLASELANVARGSSPYDYWTLFLTMCSDAGQGLDPSYGDVGLEEARSGHSPIMEAAVLRMIGLQQINPATLDESRRIWEACGALPLIARTQAEAAILRGDRAELDVAIAYLESIRDEAQVVRYSREFRSRAN